MADQRERLIWDTVVNTTNAESGFKRLGRAASDTDDDVIALAKRLDEIGTKSAQARIALQGDKEALAQLDRLDLKMKMIGDKIMSPDVKIEGVARAAADLSTIDAAIDKVGKKSDTATKSISALGGIGGGAGPTGMGALIAGASAIAPVLVTLGFGFSGLAAAAYGVYKPISNAAQATGGLQKNLKTLDPMEKTVAEGLLRLGKEFDGFQKALRPGVFGIFNEAMTLTGHLMKDIEPVANATGKAFGAFLSQLDRMFQGGEWQQFFQFMAKTAAPDMQALGNVFTGLLKDLPPLLEGMQPLSIAILKAAGSLTTMIHDLEQGNTGLENFIKFTKQVGTTGLPQVSHSSGILSQAFHLLVDAGKAGSDAIRNWSFTSTSATKSASGLSQAQQNLVKSEVAAQKAFEAAHGGNVLYSRDLSNNATHANSVAKATFQMKLQQEGASGSTRDLSNNAVAASRVTETFAGKVKNLSDAAQLAAPNLQQVYQQVTNLHNAEQRSLSTLTSYNDALIAQYNSAATLNQNLKKSHDAIGLNTAAQRNSFSAADQYIKDTINAAKQAGNNSGEINRVITSLKNELPRLQSVKGGTQQYWQEVRTLVGWLHTLEREKAIREQIYIKGTGSYTVAQNAVSQGIQRQIPGPRATGGLIGGGVPGRDSVLSLLMPGEVVVPTRMVSAGAVDHLRGRLPGFASGGVVGSYSGNVPGLPGFINKETQATVNAIAAATAAAFKNAITSTAVGGFGATPGGGAPAANAALARRMYPPWGSGAEWAAWNAVAMRESGWNQFARNASSGAYGIPQALPPGKMGPAANPPTSNPGAQIAWMISYIKSVYGDPERAWAHELSAGWYDHGGYLPVGASIAVNTTGKPEPVGAARGPLVNVQQMVVQDATDVPKVAAELSFRIVTSGFG